MDNFKEKIQLEDNQIQERYYFWDWCMSYGWRQLGSSEGYATYTECVKDNDFAINQNPSDNWKILKAEVFQTKIR